jgi:hypothetical protein
MKRDCFAGPFRSTSSGPAAGRPVDRPDIGFLVAVSAPRFEHSRHSHGVLGAIMRNPARRNDASRDFSVEKFRAIRSACRYRGLMRLV